MEELIGILSVIAFWLCIRILMYIPELVYYISQCRDIDSKIYKKRLKKDVNEILKERENLEK